MKVQVTKLGVKINGIILGERYFEQTKEKVARIINGRPERIRDKWQTKTESDVYIDIEQLKLICKDVLEITKTQEEINKQLKDTCPECYTKGLSKKWTAKAITGFLNDKLKTNIFHS